MNVTPYPKHVLLKFIFVLLLTTGLYYQSLDDPFHFDDAITVVSNKSIHYLPDWPLTIREIIKSQPSRFVTYITFALNFYVHQLDAFGYHLVNIIIHLTTVLLVWQLGEWMFMFYRKPFSTGSTQGSVKKRQRHQIQISAIDPSERWTKEMPFVAALLFLAHPVNTQAVSYISQRSESLAAMFYAAAVLFYLRARTSEGQSRLYFAISFVSGLLATFSKETAVSLPLMILMVEWYFFRKEKEERARKAFPAWAIISLIALFLILVPAAFQFQYVSKLTTPYLSQSHLGDVLTPGTYLLTQLKVFATFLRLIFFPAGLNLDYDFPMVSSLTDPGAVFCFLLLAGLLVSALVFRRKNPLLAFSVFWFFLTLSSNLVPRAHVMFEHKLYLALTGFLPAFCLGMMFLFKNSRTLITVFVIAGLVFSVVTFKRNRVWDSDVTLWEDVLQKSPEKARVHLSLATAYAQAGNDEEAIKYFSQTIEMMADPYMPYLNRGAVYAKMKRDDLALKDFNEAIRINPQGVDAYINRGEILARRKNYEAALTDFETTIAIDPQYSSGYKMRARIYDAQQQYVQALSDYDRALAIEPADAQVHAWRGYIFASQGQLDKALNDFNAAIRFDPKFSDAYVYRGMYYKDRGLTAKAFKDLNTALKLKPTSSIAFYQRAQLNFSSGDNREALKDAGQAITLDDQFDLPYALRALLYAQINEYDLALDDFEQAIALNPDSFETHMNRGSLYLMMNNPVKAVEDFTQAVHLNPSAGQAFSKRGGAYGHLGKYELAAADFTKAIELNPQGGTEYFNRSQIYKESRQRQKALVDALKAKELGFPVQDEYLDGLR